MGTEFQGIELSKQLVAGEVKSEITVPATSFLGREIQGSRTISHTNHVYYIKYIIVLYVIFSIITSSFSFPTNLFLN